MPRVTSRCTLFLPIAFALVGCSGGAGHDVASGVEGGTGVGREAGARPASDAATVSDAQAVDASPDAGAAPSGEGGAGGGDAGLVAPDAGCTAFDVPLASLTAHNTSASPNYDQAHFSANFGTTSWVSQAGATIPVDPSRMDMSMNPMTPGHVSRMDVHSLIPSRPDLRWFAHVTPWFRTGGGSHIDIGLNNDSSAYVQAMVTDMKNRGFDGLIVDWYGKGSFEDSVTLLIQQYLSTLPPNTFKFIVMMDKGIANLSQAVLETQVAYCQSQYFTDPNYELEGTAPILMFFGVDSAIGSTGMAAVKSAAGGNMVWVTQGSGSLSNSWVDQSFSWTNDFHTGDSTTDPYNLGAVSSYYSAVSGSSKSAFGSMVAGFNGTLTKNVSWSKGKYLPRGSGACVVEWAKKIDAVIPPNVTRMQWATWSDWEEGTQIESGVENDVTVSVSVTGSILSWTYTSGTGDESTIDHYEVYASADGMNAADVGSILTGTHSFNLGSAGCLVTGTSYQVEVVAVGRPTLRDHASGVVMY
jgi:hypothetical protein